MGLTRKIWLLWLQGWNSAPELVKLVRESWQFHNPDWEIVLLDQENIHQYIDIPNTILKFKRFPCFRITNAALSDIIRLKLLAQHGGVWADATMACLRPLDGWAHDAVRPAGFWMYHGRDNGRGPASWFMMSEPGAYIPVEWDKQADLFWKAGTRSVAYHWMDMLFAKLAKTDPHFLEEWKRVPFLDCELPGEAHFFARRVYLFDPDRINLINTNPPVAVKLCFKGKLHENTNAWHILKHVAMQQRANNIEPIVWQSAPSYDGAEFFP
jgi:hypothetical protein